MSIDRDRLEWAVSEGLVKAIPRGSLTLYNYTDRCAYSRSWDATTEAARGLVLGHDGQIVARPFRKFFNLGERPETQLDALPQGVPEIAEKLDGSLVIVFHDPEFDRWTCITRGSWDSVQAVRAQAMIDVQFSGDPGCTYLFEFIAPWNRIVVQYDTEELVMLGVVSNATGRDAHSRMVEMVASATGFRSARWYRGPLDSIDRDRKGFHGEEGHVARWPNGFRVKVKYAEYVRLHKVLTGLSVKGVWEGLRDGGDGTPPDGMPDEFNQWHRDVVRGLREQHAMIVEAAREVYESRDWSVMARRDVARDWMQRDPTVRACLFAMLDDKDWNRIAWMAVKPDAHDTFSTVTP